MKSTTLSAKNRRVLDPTIINNDYEVPQFIETRARPAPDFVPQSQLKPKLLRAARRVRGGSVQPDSQHIKQVLNLDIAEETSKTTTAGKGDEVPETKDDPELKPDEVAS